MGAPLVKTRWAVIVEEDEAFAERVSRALARLGFSVETTSSAQGSVDKVIELCPEVVVLGASLPGAAGICDDVKALDSVIRVILAGATASHPEGNVDGYIDKKMDEDELAEVAATVLGTAREAGAPAATADAVERLRRQFAEARRAPRSGTAGAEDVLDDRDGEIARLQAEVADREQRILAIQGKRRRVVAELAEALRLSRKSRRDLEVLLDSAQTTLDAALREREDSERLHERENQEHIERFSLEEERRRELEADLAEHRGALRRLSEERTALESSHAQAISTHEEERRRVLRRSTDERVALEAASQTRQQEIVREHEARLAEVETRARHQSEQLRAAMVALEDNLRAEAERALAAARTAHAEALATREREHAACSCAAACSRSRVARASAARSCSD